MSGGTVKRRLGDRRARPRFEIVGELFGSLETVLRLPLKNVGIGGALFESHVPLAAESIHRLTWKCDDRETAVQVRVRHVKPIESADGERTYQIGIEFMSLNPTIAGQIQDWIRGSGSGARGAGAGIGIVD
jgi:hypothetical protein